MTRWEYKSFRWKPVGNEREILNTEPIEYWEGLVDRWLCRLGAEGWEIVSQRQYNYEMAVLMKRPVK